MPDQPNLDLPLLSLVIPTYGSKGVTLTQACLASVVSSGAMPLSPEIFVIDDGSDDASVDALRDLCDAFHATLFHNPENTGCFAHNVNIGIQASSGHVVVLLNNDVELLPGCLQILVDSVVGMGFGITAPKLIYPDDTIQFAGTVYIPNPNDVTAHGWFDHLLRFRNRWEYDACASRASLVTGACMAIGRGVIDTVGLFDERLLLAAEDVDYCLRALSAGIRVAYMGHAEAIHHEGQTRGRTLEEKALHPEWTQREETGLNFLFDKWSALDFMEFGVSIAR